MAKTPFSRIEMRRSGCDQQLMPRDGTEPHTLQDDSNNPFLFRWRALLVDLAHDRNVLGLLHPAHGQLVKQAIHGLDRELPILDGRAGGDLMIAYSGKVAGVRGVLQLC